MNPISLQLGRHRFVTLGFIVVLTIASIFLYAEKVVSPSVAILGLGIIWISALPGFLYLSGYDKSAIPYLPTVGIFYIFFFGLPVFVLPVVWPDGNYFFAYGLNIVETPRVEVFALVFGALSLMVAVFYLSRDRLFVRLPPLSLPKDTPAVTLNILYWILVISHLAYRYSPDLQSVPSIGQFLDPAGFVGFGGLYLQWRRQKIGRTQKILLLFVCVPLELFWRAKILFLTDIFLFAAFFGFVLWRERQFKIIAALILFGVLLLTVYGSSVQTRSSFDTVSERFVVTAKLYWALMIDGQEHVKMRGEIERNFGAEGRFGALGKRTGHIWIFSRVYEMTPVPVPFWRGETYKPLLTSFIPRAIYTNKPEEKAGHLFGVRYSVLKPTNVQTSLNLPWITELLANFGSAGVLIGMSLIGALLAFLEKYFLSREASDTEFIVGTSIVFPLVYPESNFSVMTGSMLLLFISLMIYFRFGPVCLRQIAGQRHP